MKNGRDYSWPGMESMDLLCVYYTTDIHLKLTIKFFFCNTAMNSTTPYLMSCVFFWPILYFRFETDKREALIYLSDFC